ncbi:MAG: ATP-dependent helicase, partial [Lachnospiraceae bacterium]|nr:ATP-dependent helicase [Lachnospiraceae bacterium]
IMVMCLELLQQRPDILAGWQKRFQYILIDEFQDINLIQYRIARLLAAPEDNLFIVGDDDQSIYRFRGAKPEIMLNFTKDYPKAKEISLTVNYRSHQKIVSAASKVIEHNAVRLKKEITAASQEEGLVTVWPCPTIKEEYTRLIERIKQYLEEGYSPGDIAILFRTNVGQNNLVSKLLEHNLPFTMESFLPNLFDHWAVQDILAYMRVAYGSRERRDILRIINKPNRYVSRSFLTESQVDLELLKKNCGDKDWLKDRLITFEQSLAMIRRMVPYGAIRYIRKAVGYDEYVIEYANYRRLDPKEVFGVLDEFESAVEGIRTYPALLKHIHEYAQTLKEKAKESKSGELAKDRIVIQTMHSSKGLEYPIVLLPDVNEGVMPHSRATSEADVEEERRLFYVAMTRAKERLHLFYVRERYSQKAQCSRYVDELLGTGGK